MGQRTTSPAVHDPLLPDAGITRLVEHTLTDRVALVTGAGSGIGQACAHLLAAAGARVALVGRTLDELNRTRDQIASAWGGDRSLPVRADIAKSEDLTAATRKIESHWGRLDIVVANAGINGVWAALEELSPEDWDQTLGINLRGTYLTLRATVPLLKRNGRGAIVLVSSINGTRIFGNTGATAYSASKAGQVAMGRMLALELAPCRIRVNTICPGAIRTSIDENTERRDLDDLGVPVEYPQGSIPLTDGQPGDAVQVAQLVWFLVSDAASHITGTEVYIDGGQSLVEG